MSKFEPYSLTWQGREYTVPANRMMGAIARVEDFLTLGELQEFARKQAAPLGKIARSYAALLNYAGAEGVTDEDVYAGMFGGDPAENAEKIQNAILGLMAVMMPPAGMMNRGATGTPGKSGGATAASRSSRKPGKRR